MGSPEKRLSMSSKRSSVVSDRSSNIEELREALNKVPIPKTLSKNGTAATSQIFDGCVILGNGENAYHTRYWINHVQARSGLNRAVMQEECVPCCLEEARETPRQCIWSFIKSEAFLFSLHMTALVLGVMKEAMDVREMSEKLELAHSLIETFVAMLMITIRMIVGWSTYKEFKHKAFECEKLSATSKDEARGKMIRKFRNILLIVGSLLVAFSLICFLLFKFLVHLGWTILSNNFSMVVASVVSGLYMARVESATSSIRADQQKAILCECLLLLQESYDAHKQGTADDFYVRRAGRFLRALEETEDMKTPEHINLDNKYNLKYSMLTAMEMQSMA